MTDPLARLKRAAASKRRSDEKYRAALLVALEAGHTYAEVARVVGLSRQAVRQFTIRPRQTGP